DRIVVIGDGLMTAGAERAALEAAMKRFARVDVVLAGGIRDDDLAAALVRAGHPAGAVLDLADDDAVAALGQPVLVDVPIEIAGASWTYPSKLATARAGTSAMVYARLAKPAQTIDVAVGGKHKSLALL